MNDGLSRSQLRTKKRKARGLCVQCGHPKDLGGIRCSSCNKKAVERRRKTRKEGGLCLKCARPNDCQSTVCTSCKSVQANVVREWRAKRKAAGLCVQCGKAPSTARSYCETCWFSVFAWNSLKDKTQGSALKEKFLGQNRRCFYTGEQLIPGQNASLDHIVPVSRGGERTIENTRWVSKLVNRMKTDMTHDEFVRTCLFISAQFEHTIAVTASGCEVLTRRDRPLRSSET